jgi:hypothetical protein
VHKRSAEIRSTNCQFKTKVNMKNKTSILVGTRHFFYALLVAVIFCGCENESNTQVVKEEKLQEYKIIVIDSCEYIEKYNGYQLGMNFSHKGNCKFCAERSKK